MDRLPTPTDQKVRGSNPFGRTEVNRTRSSRRVPGVQTRVVQGVGGIQISCQLSGADNAQPMVFLHGLGEQAASWQSVEPGFASGFRVVAVDLRGHGASDWPGSYTYELMRDDVLAVLDALDLHDIVLVGHSMGGVVAYLVAQAQPRPDVELPFDWLVLEAIPGATDDPSRSWWPHLTAITAPTLITIPVGHHVHDNAPEEFSNAVMTWLSNGAARV